MLELEAQLADRDVTFELTPELSLARRKGLRRRLRRHRSARVIQDHIKKPRGISRGDCSGASISGSMVSWIQWRDECLAHCGQMAGAGGAAHRCAERGRGDRLCPLVLFRLCDMAVRHAMRSICETLTPWAVFLAGLAALLGHARSIWLNFAGGKSAATGLGVLLAMSWPVGLGSTAAAFGVVVAVFADRVLGSMLGAVTAIALVCGLPQPLAYRFAGDRRRRLRDRAPSGQHPTAAGRDGAGRVGQGASNARAHCAFCGRPSAT